MFLYTLFLLTLFLIKESQFNDHGFKYRAFKDDTEFCPKETDSCITVENNRTKGAECYDSDECPGNDVCCSDKCFPHKICKKRSGNVVESENSGNGRVPILPTFKVLESRVENCPHDTSDCNPPSKDTTRYACRDDGCPKSYKCCDDKCVQHKVCKKANVTIVKVAIKIPPDENSGEPSLPDKSTTESGNNNESPGGSDGDDEDEENPGGLENDPGEKNDSCPAEDLACTDALNVDETKQFDCDQHACPPNFQCCKDSCFKHRICKEISASNEPNGNDISTSRIREICPTNEEHCVLPADIKHAQFCANETKCPIGLRCCRDACFSKNVCRRPELWIEARTECCPEDQKAKTCNTLTGNIDIPQRYVCNVNTSNCPEHYKCCLDECFGIYLCKEPTVVIQVKKLVPPSDMVIGDESIVSSIDDNKQSIILNQTINGTVFITRIVPICPIGQMTNCSNTFNEQETGKFRCEQEGQCPKGYKCCSHGCFAHKICSHTDGRLETVKVACPPDPNPCPSATGQEAVCTADSGCPAENKCCHDNCIQKNICKRAQYILVSNETLPNVDPNKNGSSEGNATQPGGQPPGPGGPPPGPGVPGNTTQPPGAPGATIQPPGEPGATIQPPGEPGTAIQPPAEPGNPQPPAVPGTTQPPAAPGPTQPPVAPEATQPPVAPGPTQPPVAPEATQPPVAPGATQPPAATTKP